VIRLFHVYYPIRSLVLFFGEAFLVLGSFLLATALIAGPDTSIILNYEGGFEKVLIVSLVSILVAHFFDLYDLQKLTSSNEVYFRILGVVGLISLLLGLVGWLFPDFLLPKGSFLYGLIILTFILMLWRTTYAWLAQKPYLTEKIFVAGSGKRAERLVTGLRNRKDLGIEVVAWSGALGGEPSRDELGASLFNIARNRGVDRIIVALDDRRGSLPVSELLELKLSGVRIEEATTLLERISGRIELDQLRPSWLIFSNGFSLNLMTQLLRRAFSSLVALAVLLLALPLIPLIALAIKLSSSGPVFYRQLRVGKNRRPFHCYKFRTMRKDAEADCGATWASDDDPRITRVGRILRQTRLDEIPQLWNVLKGDMGFVGPRPERPEFVESLSREIPFYNLRHVIRPGLSGWAQVRYKYGNTVEDARSKLEYDLYYIKNCSIGLDFLILFETLKTVILARGAK